MKKQCFKCKRVLDIEEFYKHKQTKDGYLNKCKDCARRDSSVRNIVRADKIREYELKRSKTEKRKALRKKYVEKYRKEHPERNAFYIKIKKAIDSGKITRPNFCSICGKGCKTVAHHYDYSKPLDVIFVCQSCHKRIHSRSLFRQ